MVAGGFPYETPGNLLLHGVMPKCTFGHVVAPAHTVLCEEQERGRDISRHASVRFSPIRRNRELTLNAIYFDTNGGIL